MNSSFPSMIRFFGLLLLWMLPLTVWAELSGELQQVRLLPESLAVAEPCKKYIEVFASHLVKRSPGVTVVTGSEAKNAPGTGVLTIRLCIGFAPEQSPGEEGYEIDIASAGPGCLATIRGADARGILFGLGRLLRETELTAGGFRLPYFRDKTAPRYAVRGANQNYMDKIDGAVARRTKARAWSREEAIFYLEELFLQGQNIYLHGWGTSSSVTEKNYDPSQKIIRGVNLNYANLARDYGMMYFLGNAVNGIGADNMKNDSWRAIVHREPNKALACPSNPEARAAILRIRDIYFKHIPRLDYVMLQPADVAGCECAKCAPWPETYYRLCVEIAAIIHRYHPQCKVMISNQEFSIEDNRRFFDLMRRENSPGVNGYVYAPGCSENSSYGYVVPDPDWMRYPGVYPASTFLKSRLKYLNPEQQVMAMMDIGHWNRVQNSVPRIDPVFSEIYPRRTFNVRPRAITQAWREVFPYSDQLIGYSETILDDFEKYLSLRLAWDPDLDARTIVREYYTYYCGPGAGAILADAVFLGERNYELPVAGNEKNIRRFYDSVEKAWSIMPECYRRDNWRMLALRQRAATDLYLVLRVAAQQKAYDAAIREVAGLKVSRERLTALADALEFKESPELVKLHEAIIGFDNETDRIIGVRCLSVGKIGTADNVGVGYLAAGLRRAAALSGDGERARELAALVNYDRVGPGEFYDNCGTPDRQPHFDFSSGELYYGTGIWPEASRPSQRYYNYTAMRQPGLRFRYRGLDQKAAYRVEVVYPNPKGVSFALNSPNVFEVYADGERIGEGRPSGEGFDRFAFDIPAGLTSDGALDIEIRKKAGEAVCTCISEIWIRKR